VYNIFVVLSGIETGMSRETIVSGMDTANTILARWSKLGLRKKCGTSCGRI
jgi:hypothetical protein